MLHNLNYKYVVIIKGNLTFANKIEKEKYNPRASVAS